MPTERRGDGAIGDSDLGCDGIDGLVLHQVPLVQVASDVGEAHRTHARDPASVKSRAGQQPRRRRGSGIHKCQVTREPVLVQSGLQADRRQGQPELTEQRPWAVVGESDALVLELRTVILVVWWHE